MKIEYPIQELERFHKDTTKRMKLLQKAINRLEKDKDIEKFEDVFVDFFNFCENELPIHVEDEEHALFPMLRTRIPITRGNTGNDGIIDMLNDHKDIYAAIEVIKLMKRLIGGEKNSDDKYLAEIIARTRNIIELMDDHFTKEENVLFKMVGDILTPNQITEIAHKMTKIRECRVDNGEGVKSCKIA